MSFTYNSVFTKTSTQTPWFFEAYPAEAEASLNFIKSSPGYISGNWRVDPSNPKQYLITHEWASKEDWQAMGDALKQQSFGQARKQYIKQYTIRQDTTLSE